MDAEKTLQEAIEETMRLGQIYHDLVSRQAREIARLRAELARVRELRELDYRLTRPLTIWGAVTLWVRSLWLTEDEEEDSFDLKGS